MSEYIRIEPMDLVVYGQVQYSFVKVDAPAGSAPMAYDQAVCAAALQRAVAVQTEFEPIQAAIRVRATKLKELGDCLANVTSTVTQFQVDKVKLSDEKTKYSLGQVNGTNVSVYLAKYGIYYDEKNAVSAGVNSYSYANCSKLQENIKLAIDKENTDVERDTSALQGYLNKSDSAYSLIGTLQKKIDGTANHTIKQIGG